MVEDCGGKEGGKVGLGGGWRRGGAKMASAPGV